MTGESRDRTLLIRFIGALAGVLVAGLVFVTVSADLRRTVGGPGSIFGWAIPLVALFVIVAVTWLLLARDTYRPEDDETVYVNCETCGHSVLREWRLCPYCGAQLQEAQAAGESLGT